MGCWADVGIWGWGNDGICVFHVDPMVVSGFLMAAARLLRKLLLTARDCVLGRLEVGKVGAP